MVVSTLNKTLESYLVGIVGAEYVTGMLPIGTHDWQRFLEPATIIQQFEQEGLKPLMIKGLTYSFLTHQWQLSNCLQVNYIVAFMKSPD